MLFVFATSVCCVVGVHCGHCVVNVHNVIEGVYHVVIGVHCVVVDVHHVPNYWFFKIKHILRIVSFQIKIDRSFCLVENFQQFEEMLFIIR